MGPSRFEASVHKIKEQVLPRLLERVDPEAAATLTKDELSEEFRPIIMEVLAELKITFNRREQFALEKVLIDELLGFGPLEELLNDPDVSDIMVNGPDQTYIEKKGKLRSRRSSSATNSTCSRSPSASSTRSAAASTRPRRWPTPA
jgi:pilus assembly protein CpaF